MSDELFLRETLKLAKKGMSWTNPNPMVGAIIVENGRILGKGYHKKVGLPHAEIEAITHARGRLAKLKGGTLYVNIEPCIHFGKTPPCVDEIIRSGIKRVVCATYDPNPKVHGGGLKKLQRAGIAVSVDILKDEARSLNEAFFTFHEKRHPFTALKFAASLDGKIATKTGNSKWITNEKARDYARNLRAKYQAVLVGINTVIEDNPHLGVRVKGFKDPIRIILDSTLKIPVRSNILRDQNVIIATTSKANRKKKQLFTRMGISLITFDGDQIPVDALLKELVKREIVSILVEGGGKTLGSFLDAGLVDKVYAFHAPILIGGERGKSTISGKGAKQIKDALKLKQVTFQRFGDNILTIGYV